MAMFTDMYLDLVSEARREFSEPSDLSAKIQRAWGCWVPFDVVVDEKGDGQLVDGLDEANHDRD